MRTVWKYQLPVDDTSVFTMPSGARVLPYIESYLGHAVLTIWVEVDTDQPPAHRMLAVHGTGHPIHEDEEYIGTVRDGQFMWHIYDGGEV